MIKIPSIAYNSSHLSDIFIFGPLETAATCATIIGPTKPELNERRKEILTNVQCDKVVVKWHLNFAN